MICRRCSGRGRRSGPGIAGWPATAPGTGAGAATHRGGRGRPDRLVGVGGLHDRPRASARDEPHPRPQGAGSNYTNPRIEPPDHAIGRSRGGLDDQDPPPRRRRTAGPLVIACIVPGRPATRRCSRTLMRQSACRPPRTSVEPALDARPFRGDKAYSSRAIRGHLARPRHHGGDPRARRSDRPPQTPRFPRRTPTRLRRRATTAAATSSNAASTCFKQWRALATRYDKLAIVYRAAVVLHAVVTWTQTLSDTP